MRLFLLLYAAALVVAFAVWPGATAATLELAGAAFFGWLGWTLHRYSELGYDPFAIRKKKD